MSNLRQIAGTHSSDSFQDQASGERRSPVAMLVIPILACGSLGAIVGYIYRYRPMARRLVTLGVATFIFILAEKWPELCPPITP